MIMKYKGYLGRVDLDPEADLLHGEVVGTRDVITFQARTPKKLLQAFRDSVDDYLDFCKTRGEEPDKPFSGKFVIRTHPHMHRAMSLAAEREGESLNAWINAHLRPAISSAEQLMKSPLRRTAAKKQRSRQGPTR
jgi:predicted HicB family RNase H-like nuclease